MVIIKKQTHIPPFTPVEMRMGGRPSSGIRFIALPTGLPTWVILPENKEISVYKKQISEYYRMLETPAEQNLKWKPKWTLKCPIF